MQDQLRLVFEDFFPSPLSRVLNLSSNEQLSQPATKDTDKIVLPTGPPMKSTHPNFYSVHNSSSEEQS